VGVEDVTDLIDDLEQALTASAPAASRARAGYR
jgi:hypothetical protein